MDFLNLFKNEQPKFETVLPFSQKKVLFSAFKVKDAKKISLILQENNKKLSLISMYECLKDNSDIKNIEDLCLADAEYLFLQIRSKSVDELLNVLVNGNKIKIQINDILSKNKIQTKTISLGKSITINLETPTVHRLLKQNEFNEESYAKSCIKSISISGQTFYLDKYVNDQCQEIIDNLPITIVKELNSFIAEEPKLYFKVNVENSESEVSGLLSFFT